jgi:SAM-dependent methyltransferase
VSASGRDGVETLLRSYPRARPELPPRHSETYIEHYRANRAGKTGVGRIAMRLESWMHRQVAADCDAERILELGAGSLNHLPYHPHARVYDAVEPFRELWEDSPERGRIGHMYSDIAEIPGHQRYDAIVSVAVLEHLTDLPAIVARAALLLAEGGEFRAGFPSEGGLLWGLAWRGTTGLEYRWKRGLDYSAIMRHEHVNSADEIVAVLGYFFETVELRRFPSPWRHLSFYTAAIARAPRKDRSRKDRSRG